MRAYDLNQHLLWSVHYWLGLHNEVMLTANSWDAAMNALKEEGIEINENVDRVLSVSIPAVQAYLSMGDPVGDGQPL